MAKRFRFRLEAVQRVRTQKRDAQRREVAAAAQRATDVEQRLGQLGDTLRATLDGSRSRRCAERLDVAVLSGDQQQREFLHRAILACQEELRQRQQELKAERVKLADTSKRLKVIETLREKQWRRHREEANREEQAEGDEVAVQRYVRAHAESFGEERT